MALDSLIDASAIEALFEKVNALEARVAVLETGHEPLIDYRAPGNTPEECQAHACTYFDHYLAQGPATLTHEGFHAAERKCGAAQNDLLDWQAAYQQDEDDMEEQLHLMRQAERWERAVRA